MGSWHACGVPHTYRKKYSHTESKTNKIRMNWKRFFLIWRVGCQSLHQIIGIAAYLLTRLVVSGIQDSQNLSQLEPSLGSYASWGRHVHSCLADSADSSHNHPRQTLKLKELRASVWSCTFQLVLVFFYFLSLLPFLTNLYTMVQTAPLGFSANFHNL